MYETNLWIVKNVFVTHFLYDYIFQGVSRLEAWVLFHFCHEHPRKLPSPISTDNILKKYFDVKHDIHV